MAVLYPRYIQYGAAAERIPVELETAEPEFIVLGGILKLVRGGLKGVDTAVFSLIGHQKNAFLLNRFENGLEMLPVVGGTIGVPVPVAVIAVKIILTVKGGKTVPFPGQKFQLSVCEKQLETGACIRDFSHAFWRFVSGTVGTACSRRDVKVCLSCSSRRAHVPSVSLGIMDRALSWNP